MRENRETPLVAHGRKAAGRRKKAMSHKFLMHDGGESSDCIVPAKSANKGSELLAEQVEGRRSAKGTPGMGRCWTPS